MKNVNSLNTQTKEQEIVEINENLIAEYEKLLAQNYAKDIKIEQLTKALQEEKQFNQVATAKEFKELQDTIKTLQLTTPEINWKCARLKRHIKHQEKETQELEEKYAELNQKKDELCDKNIKLGKILKKIIKVQEIHPVVKSKCMRMVEQDTPNQDGREININVVPRLNMQALNVNQNNIISEESPHFSDISSINDSLYNSQWSIDSLLQETSTKQKAKQQQRPTTAYGNKSTKNIPTKPKRINIDFNNTNMLQSYIPNQTSQFKQQTSKYDNKKLLKPLPNNATFLQPFSKRIDNNINKYGGTPKHPRICGTQSGFRNNN